MQVHTELPCADPALGLSVLNPGSKALSPLPLCSCQGEAQRGTVTCLRSHGKQVATPDQPSLLSHILEVLGARFLPQPLPRDSAQSKL